MMKNAHAYNERRGIGNNVANATFSMHAFFPGRRFSARALRNFQREVTFVKGGGVAIHILSDHQNI